MKNITLVALTCALVCVIRPLAAQDFRLEPLSSFGMHGDGSVRPGDFPFLTEEGQRYQRGMAYNPVTGHVLVVNRDPLLQGIFILDGTTGAHLGNLDFSGYLPGGNESFVINLIGIGDDGVIYVGNLTSATSPPQFRLYRWENEGAPQTLAYPVETTAPSDPSNGNTNAINRRWGDTMAVRGSGANTEILLASRGTLVSVLTPTPGDVTKFTATPVQTTVPPGALGYGLSFGPGNTVFGTAGAQSGGPLYVLERLPGASNATTIATFGATVIPNNLTPLSVGRAFGRDFLAGISMTPGPDILRFYDLGGGPTNPPVFLDRESFITSSNNAVFAGAVAFGGNRVYALDSDNGLMAFSIVQTNSPVAPAIFLQPVSRSVLVGSNVTLVAADDGTPPLSYQWLFNGAEISGANSTSLVISNAQTTNSGSYSVIISNAAGAIISSNAVLSVSAQLASTSLLYDPFDYTADTPLTNHGGWLLNSGTSARVETGNLPVTGLLPPMGNRAFWGATSMSVRRPLGTNITSGSTYYSFVMNVESLGAGFTGNGVLAGFTTGTGTSFGTKVDIRNNGGTSFTLGTSKAGSATLVFDTNNFPTGTNIFLVGRYTFNPASGDDVAELWINPPAETFGTANPPPANLVTTGGTDLAQIERFFFRAGSASTTPAKLVVDELRVGGTWKDVTPVPMLPRLSIIRSGDTITILWASAGAEDAVLESTTVLPGAEWEQITEQVIGQDGTNSVTVFPQDAQRFYRLRHL